jgi:hypothetical protein
VTSEYHTHDALSAELNDAISYAIHSVCAKHQVMPESWTGMLNFTTINGDRGWMFINDDESLHMTQRAMILFMHEYQSEVTRLNIHDHLMSLDGDE